MADCSKTVDFFEELFRQKRKECPANIFGCDKCRREDCKLVIVPKEFDTARAICMLQEWSDEHPLKSFLDDFKEKYPNSILSCKGKPKACRRLLYGGSCRSDRDCLACWKEEMT